MALPALPALPPDRADRELLMLLLVRVEEMLERFGTIEETLERYRPLLEMAEARMSGPRLFGRGVSRVDQTTPRR